METEATRRELGRLVRERRKALRLTQADIQKAGGPSTATLRLIEGGRAADLRSSTIDPLERALQWVPGSIAAILDGGRPSLESRDAKEWWRGGQEALESPMPPAGDSLDADLDFIVTNLRAALGMLQKRKLWLAIQLINQASSDLSDYIDSQEDPNAEPTSPTANTSSTSSGAQGAKDQEGHAGDGQQSDYDLAQRKRDPRVDPEIPDDEDWPADPDGPETGA